MKAYVYDATTQQAHVEEFEPEGALRMLQNRGRWMCGVLHAGHAARPQHRHVGQ